MHDSMDVWLCLVPAVRGVRAEADEGGTAAAGAETQEAVGQPARQERRRRQRA